MTEALHIVRDANEQAGTASLVVKLLAIVAGQRARYDAIAAEREALIGDVARLSAEIVRLRGNPNA